MIPIENPQTAYWGLKISDRDFAKLKRGFLAKSSDDRWAFLPMSDEELVKQDEEVEAERLAPPERKSSTPEEEELTEEEQEQRHREFFEMLERDERERDKRETEWEAAADVIHLDVKCNISIRLAWYNREWWRIVVESRRAADGDAGSAKIESITWGNQITEAQAKIDVIIKCRAWTECDIDAAPEYDALDGTVW